MKIKKRIIFLIILVGLIGLFAAGPRAQIDTHVTELDNLPADLEQYLAEAEAQYPDIIPGTEKKIIWANENKQQTPLAIIYLHGFSATRQETAPLSDELAAKLGANLFYTRLSGHGQTGAALGRATAQQWLQDSEQALAIGRRLGEQVIVIGTSNGGTLATWLATQPTTEDVRAYVLISPNFGPKDPLGETLTWPWAMQLMPLVFGDTRSWEPINELEALYWTESYPIPVLFQAMALVKYVRESDLEGIKTPVLVVYSPNDQVVEATRIEAAFERFGADQKQLIPITEKVSAYDHVLAGDILAPTNTTPMVKIILDFLTGLK